VAKVVEFSTSSECFICKAGDIIPIPVSSFCPQNVRKEPEEAQQDILTKSIKEMFEKSKIRINLQSAFSVYSFKFW
jgi:hypothetical protein